MTLAINGFPYILNEFTDREINWIDSRLANSSPRLEGDEIKRSRVGEFMHQDEECYRNVKQLRLDSSSYLLADDELEWMESTDRKFLNWLKTRHFPLDETGPLYQMVAAPPLPAKTMNLPGASFYRAYISHLDDWDVELQIKRDFLSFVRSEWYYQQQLDKKLRWIDMKNPEQINWIWEYLQQNLIRTSNYNLSNNNFDPINDEEMYFSIFTRFYEWQRHPAELKEIQGRMKQAWAQQKYRSSLKGRKQSTYVLSDQTKKQLKTLAGINNVNLNQMLEYIINEAYENLKKRTPKKYTDEGNLND